jgi:coenzyme F420-reducing hydrogenase alpha subunit
MLRDRVPKLVNYALKWCKCKEKWLDHVYSNWIWIYSKKDMRDNATRDILGLDAKGKPTKFKFEDTILWDDLTKKEKSYWESVSKWVSWFQKEYQYVKNSYDISKACGKDIREIKYDIMIIYLYNMCPTEEDTPEERQEKNEYINNFVDYLIDCFENRI